MQLNRKTRRSLRIKNKRNRKATKARVYQYVTTKDGKTKKIHHIRRDDTVWSIPADSKFKDVEEVNSTNS